MAERVARDLVVRGRVQGVFFRAFVRAAAERHGVAGRAENRSDGTVAIRLEGEPAAVAAVAASCAVGPEGARVDSVDEAEAEVAGLSGFATG